MSVLIAVVMANLIAVEGLSAAYPHLCFWLCGETSHFTSLLFVCFVGLQTAIRWSSVPSP